MLRKKMANLVDYNALLLKIMAHDLLAPLTAIKWQTELLAGAKGDKDKSERYIKGISQSTELGISLTRHAHVAARVLTESYDGILEKAQFSKVVDEAIADLYLQFERHALVLESQIEEMQGEQEFDTALTRLFVWSIAKYFLATMPPHTVVTMNGNIAQSEGKYTVRASVQNITNEEELVRTFDMQEQEGGYDQKYVFAKLVHEIAPHLEARVSAKAEAGNFSISVTFI
jgi:hypothetical protein